MINNYILSTNQIMKLIDSKYYMLNEFTESNYLTKLDLLAIVIEFMEFTSHGGISVTDYISDHWLLEEPIIPVICLFIESLMDDIKIFCPELIDVLQNNKSLQITHYDKHAIVLTKQV